MIIASRTELLRQKQMLEQASLSKTLLEQKLSLYISQLKNVAKTMQDSQSELIASDNSSFSSLILLLAEDGLKIDYYANMLNRIPVYSNQPFSQANDSTNYKMQDKYPIVFSTNIEKVKLAYQEFINDIQTYTEKTIELVGIGQVIKKTRRQLVTLEQVVIPEIEENIKHINFILDDQEMQDKVRIRKFKHLQEKRNKLEQQL